MLKMLVQHIAHGDGNPPEHKQRGDEDEGDQVFIFGKRGWLGFRCYSGCLHDVGKMSLGCKAVIPIKLPDFASTCGNGPIHTALVNGPVNL